MIATGSSGRGLSGDDDDVRELSGPRPSAGVFRSHGHRPPETTIRDLLEVAGGPKDCLDESGVCA